MRKPAFAGLLLCALFFSAHSPTVSAQAPDILEFDTKISTASQLALEEVTQPEPSVPPPPIRHVVQRGETLTSIAVTYNTTWVRLYDKNPSLQDPDVITLNSELTIPSPEEALASRPLPTETVPELVEEVSPGLKRPAQPARRASSNISRAASSGNGYVRGYCTWYTKNRRPDLPNNLGNADTWVTRARAQGISTGSTPQVGAIGQQGMHVVYVESVNGDGTVTVSEMNFTGWNVISSRTVSASNFLYIY